MSKKYHVGSVPNDYTGIIMKYYIYDMKTNHDLVKDNLSELATMTFEKGWSPFEGIKIYREGEENEIQSKMTDICKQTFGECDRDNRLFSFNNTYKIQILVVDIEDAGIYHCIMRLQTPVPSLVYQSQGCYAEHRFVASFRYREGKFFFNSQNRRCTEIEVLESHLWYEGLHQLDPLLCTDHHIKSVARNELPETGGR
jgi:hypothetical protein